MARDLGLHGVRFNAVAPGLVMTPLTEKKAQDIERLQTMVVRTLLGRVVEPDDIAGPVDAGCTAN